MNTILLHLLFSCPFCDLSLGNLIPEVPPSSGLLVILNSTPVSPFPTGWTIIEACNFLELKNKERTPSLNGGMRGSLYTQMAWIARPCGRVTTIGGVEGMQRERTVQSGITRDTESVWRHKGAIDEIGYGRFAGLLTSLHKVVLEDERVERYAQF